MMMNVYRSRRAASERDNRATDNAMYELSRHSERPNINNNMW